MLGRKRFISFARFHIGGSGHLRQTSEIVRWVAFGGESCMRLAEAATSFTTICGCQPSWFAVMNACTANLPKAKIMKTFAFEALSEATSERTSEAVGS